MYQIGLIQINSGALNFLPYSVGVLQAYVQRHARPNRYQFLLPIFRKIAVQTAINALETADILAISVYIWNLQRSLAIAQAFKRHKPQTLIIFGGPQVPDRAEDFLRQNPFIDVCTHGEGEVPFLELIEAEPERKWSKIAGISYLDANEQFQHHPRAPRRQDLSSYPSPYLNGVFDSLLAEYPNEQWDVMWETNRGCPFSCSFCDWGSATQSKIYTFPMERLEAELNWFAQSKIHQVFCCDANFGILTRDLDIAQLAANIKTQTGYPQYLAVQNTKNATERSYQVHKILAQAGLDSSVTLSLQSLTPEVLKAVRRENIALSHYQELHQRLKADRIATYTDVIIGLPGETYASFAQGVSTMMANGQHHALKFYNASVLPNAEMGQPEYQARYGIETVASRCVYLHTPVEPPLDGIVETQTLVIATASMPHEDWVKARSLAWWIDLLFYEHKLLKLALVILHAQGLSYRDLLELFSSPHALQGYPLLQRIAQFFWDKAAAIQRGDYEYCQGPEPIHSGIWWSAEAFILRQLIAEGEIGSFYEETYRLFLTRFQADGLDPVLILDAVEASRIQLQLLFKLEPAPILLNYNILEVYQGLLKEQSLPLRLEPQTYFKPWQGPPYKIVPQNQ